MTSTGPDAETSLTIQMSRVAAGTELWARCLIMGENGGTINFYFGSHEYAR